MDIAERLIAFKDYTGLTNSQFADRAGIPRPTLSQFLNGRNKRMSDDLAAKLHLAYPQLNVMWLLFGEGDMVRDENIGFSEGKNQRNDNDFDLQNTDGVNDDSISPHLSPAQDSDANRIKAAEPDLFAASDSVSAFANPTQIEINAMSQNSGSARTPFIPADPAKKIQSIMVFYSDNSYEIFTPRDS